MTQDIQRIAEVDVTATDHSEIADLLAASFDSTFEGRSYFIQPPSARLIVRDDKNRIVAQTSLFLRRIRVEVSEFRAIGLGDVAVSARCRGKGLGGRMVEEALAFGRALDQDFAMLEGDSGIYGRNGFVAVDNLIRNLNVETGRVIEETGFGFMICRLADKPWPASETVDLMGPRF